MEELDIKEFLEYAKKYALLICLITVLAAVISIFYNTGIKTPMYTTETTIVLVKDDASSTTATNSETITQSDITLNQKLVSTYRKIIKSKLVLNQVIERLNLEYTTDELDKHIKVEAEEDTEILKISVTDKDPYNAAYIANALADVFDKEITKIYNINNVSILDAAIVPTSPSNNTLIRDIFLVSLIVLLGSVGIVFVIFYFDDKLRYSENLENELQIPIIAKVFKDDESTPLVVSKKPNALTSESVRTLRTNLQFSEIDSELKTLLVTSTIPGEGKSYISSNLAVSFAQAGKKVLLIDSDLRKGCQHKIFKVLNNRGLSNLLINDIKDYRQYILKTSQENLSIIPRGVFPPNPSELLNSKKNAELIEMLKSDFDLVIIDGAPSSSLADSLILSTYVDKVLMVCSIDYTPKSELLNTKKALENVGAKLAGLVVNNMSTKQGSYGYYYYSYSETEPEKKQK